MHCLVALKALMRHTLLPGGVDRIPCQQVLQLFPDGLQATTAAVPATATQEGCKGLVRRQQPHRASCQDVRLTM